MANEDYIKIFNLLKTPTFKVFVLSLYVREPLILGYVDGKYYTTKEIETFVNIEEQMVRKIVKNVLLVYKEYADKQLKNYKMIGRVFK